MLMARKKVTTKHRMYVPTFSVVNLFIDQHRINILPIKEILDSDPHVEVHLHEHIITSVRHV